MSQMASRLHALFGKTQEMAKADYKTSSGNDGNALEV